MRADDDVYGAFCQLFQQFGALGGGGAAREYCYSQLSLACESAGGRHLEERLAGGIHTAIQIGLGGEIDLLCQHFCGCHDRSLMASACRHKHGHDADCRLARTHFALQEPLHRPRPGQVFGYFGYGALLGCCHHKRQRIVICLQEFLVGHMRDASRFSADAFSAAEQPCLHAEKLVKYQAVACQRHLFEIFGFVYPAEGVVAGDEAVLLAHFGWDRVGEASLLGSLQHFFYALVDFAGVYGVLLGLGRLAIQGYDFAYFVADGV